MSGGHVHDRETAICYICGKVYRIKDGHDCQGPRSKIISESMDKLP